MSPALRPRVSPFLFPRVKERRAQDRPGALPEAYTGTAKEDCPRRDRAKPSMVQYVRSPDPRERSRRRHGGSPGRSARRRRSRSPGRRVQPGRGTSGSSRSRRARQRSRRDSRSPSRRRRRSRSRCGRRPPVDGPGRRSWPSGDKESLQESGRWAGRDHAQEARRHGEAGFQDRDQTQGRDRAQPGWPANRDRGGHDFHRVQGGKHGGGKGYTQGRGKRRRGQGSKGKPHQEAQRAPARTEEQHQNIARRRERAAKRIGQRRPPSTTSCEARGAPKRPRTPAMRAEARRGRRPARPPQRPGSSERPEIAGERAPPQARVAQVPASFYRGLCWAPIGFATW